VDDNDKLQQLSQGFHEQSNGIFVGLVMVMDWMAVQTCAPFEKEVSKRKDYRFIKGVFFIGDDAFTNMSQFLSPWPGRGLYQYKDSFNYWLSHSCQIVERAFGMLMQH
jgi:hypothetical protein